MSKTQRLLFISVHLRRLKKKCPLAIRFALLVWKLFHNSFLEYQCCPASNALIIVSAVFKLNWVSLETEELSTVKLAALLTYVCYRQLSTTEKIKLFRLTYLVAFLPINSFLASSSGQRASTREPGVSEIFHCIYRPFFHALLPRLMSMFCAFDTR